MAKRSVTRGKGKIFRFLFRLLGILLIVAVNGIVLWRVFSSGDPASVGVLKVNRNTVDAYERAGKLTMWYQEQSTVTKAEKNYGYFGVTQWRYVEEAEQVQLVFRYNNSTIKHLKEDYKLETMPNRAEMLYDVTLYVAYDLTPEDASDNDGNDPESVRFVRYYPDRDAIGTAQKNVYNYRTYLFDGIVIDETVLAVYADIYYVGDINYEKEAYGTLCLYDYSTPRVPRELKKADTDALDAYREKMKTQTEELLTEEENG